MQGSTEDRDITKQNRLNGTLSDATKLLERLISYPSVSSTSNQPINQYCETILEQLGFAVTRSEYQDSRSVEKSNLLAVRMPAGEQANGEQANGEQAGLAYFAHTDVVPAEKWVGPGTGDSDPFTAQINEGRLYGRGACDMKGSLAAMLSAAARVDPKEQTAPLWLACTADEEVGFEGAKHLVGHCQEYRKLVASDPMTIIGEPTLLRVVHAHKGIHGFKVISEGRAAHSATTHGINANEAMVPMLVKLLELCQRTRSDASLQDNRFDPPTLSWNFGVSDHSDVVNITPGVSVAWVSLRTMPEIDGKELIDEARQTALALGLQFVEFDGCGPIWNDPDCDAVAQFRSLAGTDSQTVCYATDGGVLEELSRRIVIGPGSIEQAHTVDEWISLDQLDQGIDLYEKAIRQWCVGQTEPNTSARS